MAKLAKNSLTAGLALLIAFFFTSCTEEEPLGPNVPPGHSLYVASAIITPAPRTETEVNTRVVGDDVPVTVTTGSLGIFRSQGTGYTETLNNKQYTYMGVDKGWQPATAADTLFLNGDDVEVCAYYPHNADAAYQDATALPLYSGKYTGTSALHDPNDLCYDIYRTVNSARRATTFEMKHALSLLEFRISKEAGYVGDCRITSIAVMNPDLLTESSIDITTGTYGTTPTKGTITYNPGADADGILIESSPVTTGALLVPFTPSAEGLTIAFAVNGTPVEANIPTTNITQLEAGHRYSVKVTMKAGSMEVTGVDMMPWDEVGVGGDDYTWYPVKEKDPIDIGLDFLIAPGNLIAKAKGNGYTYAFATEQGYYSGISGEAYDPTIGGDYFYWNMLDPTATTSSNTTYVWDDTNDPCRKVKGGEWYTPTEVQLQALVAAGNVWSTYKTKDVEPKKGYYFGTITPPDEANQDKFVFLPAAGYWPGGSINFNGGGHGYYWSSTYYVGKPNENSWFLDFSQSSCDIFSTDRTAAFSVRCVKDKPLPEHAIKVEGLDFYVADGNVRAIKQDGDTYKYVFADEQGYYSGIEQTAYDPAGGDYFCWNTLSPDDFMISQTEWKDERDVCRKIGDGEWYTPTQAQLQALLDAGYVWDDNAYTMKDGTKPGMYFGTTNISIAKANQDKYVFLPAAGYRGGGSYYLVGSFGNYWSSTPSGNGAYVLDFENGYYAVDDSTLPFGRSVRCVRNK